MIFGAHKIEQVESVQHIEDDLLASEEAKRVRGVLDE